MTQSPCLPELPKLPEIVSRFEIGITSQGKRFDYTADDMQAYATTHGRACYEAGSAAAAQSAWRPIGWQFRFVFPTHASNWHTVLRLPVTDMYSGDDYRYETRLVYAAAPTQGAEGAAPQAATMCPCGDRPATECDEEWGPKCDLGNNEAHVRAHVPAPQAVVGEASERLTDAELCDLFHGCKFETMATADDLFYLIARAVEKRVRAALTTSPTPTAPQEADALREALDGITVYCGDTLSGPVEVPDDRKWYRDGIREVLKRARAALATPPAHPVLAPVVREPLTEGQLRAMRSMAREDERCMHEHWWVLFARAIEAAHGIQATTGEQSHG